MLGLGLAAAGLAILLPPTLPRPVWVNILLGIVAVVLGLLVVLVVAID